MPSCDLGRWQFKSASPTGDLCNGSTLDFDSNSVGSTPASPTKRTLMLTEKQLRELSEFTPASIGELIVYIEKLVDQEYEGEDGYGAVVYVMSLVALAAKNYAANKLGVSGFQAGMADLIFLKKAKNLDGPFFIVDARDMLYPQYDIATKVAQLMQEWKPWAAERALELLKDSSKHASEDVLAHWMNLVNTGATKPKI